MSYLGTNLSPEEYYAKHSARYSNPHEDGIRLLLEDYAPFLSSRVLDLGCGPGLATHVLKEQGLTDFVGVDNSPEMAERYQRETGFPAHTANFWDELPKADCAIAVHSLHLCSLSRLSMVMWRLTEAGVRTLVVISPLKGILGYIPFGVTSPELLKCATCPPKGKTIWARKYELHM